MKETEQTLLGQIPKEEKKEPFVKALDDIQKIENLSVNNSAHSFTESAYKEFEEAAIKQGHVIESPEPQEKMSYWQYQQFAEAAITQLKDRNEKLESDIKALREENTKCKELSWEAANEISRLKKEIERLEAEVLKEKFPEN